MKLKNETEFHIKTLNQEKLFNSLYKDFDISNIDRLDEKEVVFSCNYSQHKKLEKVLKEKNVEVLKVKHFGIFSAFSRLWTSIGLILGVVSFLIFFAIQSQFILRFEVLGIEKLQKNEVVSYINSNFKRQKTKLKTREVEIALLSEFDEISFVSCMVKGQTLIINIKEKLLPDEKYGEFKPIVSQKNAKITKIELVSGTLKVKVGDIVRVGDVLVEPYVIDSSGEIMKTSAKAKILGDVYNEASVDHYDNFVEVYRTGRTCEESVVTLFGLDIYNFKTENPFEKFEVEYEEHDLSQNNILPFKLKKKKYFELKERVVSSKFEDVKEEYIKKAREKVLANGIDCDKIIDEYYTLRHLNGITIVNYCVVTQEEIGELYVG